MGENLKIVEKQSEADRLRAEIRHTESDITETVNTLEYRLSPQHLREQGVHKAKLFAWQNTAKVLDAAQRPSVQAMVLGGAGAAGALWMLLSNRKHKLAQPPAAPEAGTAAKAAGASALLYLLRRALAGKEPAAQQPAVSGIGLAATAAKAFLGGARGTKKTGTTGPAKKAAWRGMATALGAALGSYWYNHKGHRV